MKIPIILISTKGKTKEGLLKEFKAAWKRFLIAKKVGGKEKREFNAKIEKLNELY